MWKLLFLTTFVAFTAAQTTNVAPCIVHGGSLPVNTHINECVDPPCLFYQLDNAVINMVFRAPATMRRMRSLVTAYLILGPFPVPVPYDLQEAAETCNFLTNTYCPVLEGELVAYTLQMYIDVIFPVGTRANLEFRVVDENNQPFLCIRVQMEVMPPRNGRRIANDSVSVQ